MTNEQKAQIDSMRLDGVGYVTIAKLLDVSENTIKSYCHRKKSVENQKNYVFCAECGIAIDKSKRSERRFCSNSCRMKWWNRHPKQDMPYTAHCLYCGKEISMRRKDEKKYCSHHCYILARYKGGDKGD